MKNRAIKSLTIMCGLLMPLCLQAQYGQSEMSGSTMWIIGILIFQAVVCGALSGTIAGKKGQSTGAWFGAGFLFGVFGLIAAAGLPTKKSEESAGLISTKQCPDCAEFINKQAFVCKHCGKRFEKTDMITDALHMLLDRKASNRIYALEVLGNFKDKSTLPQIVESLDSATKEFSYENQLPILEAAKETILEINDTSVVPLLNAIIQRNESDSFFSSKVRIIIEIFKEMGEPAIPYIVSALKFDTPRQYAPQTLIEMGKPTIPYLKKAMESGDKFLIKYAEKCLKVIIAKQ